eukprot:RCo007944
MPLPVAVDLALHTVVDVDREEAPKLVCFSRNVQHHHDGEKDLPNQQSKAFCGLQGHYGQGLDALGEVHRPCGKELRHQVGGPDEAHIGVVQVEINEHGHSLVVNPPRALEELELCQGSVEVRGEVPDISAVRVAVHPHPIHHRATVFRAETIVAQGGNRVPQEGRAHGIARVVPGPERGRILDSSSYRWNAAGHHAREHMVHGAPQPTLHPNLPEPHPTDAEILGDEKAPRVVAHWLSVGVRVREHRGKQAEPGIIEQITGVPDGVPVTVRGIVGVQQLPANVIGEEEQLAVKGEVGHCAEDADETEVHRGLHHKALGITSLLHHRSLHEAEHRLLFRWGLQQRSAAGQRLSHFKTKRNLANTDNTHHKDTH